MARRSIVKVKRNRIRSKARKLSTKRRVTGGANTDQWSQQWDKLGFGDQTPLTASPPPSIYGDMPSQLPSSPFVAPSPTPSMGASARENKYGPTSQISDEEMRKYTELGRRMSSGDITSDDWLVASGFKEGTSPPAAATAKQEPEAAKKTKHLRFQRKKKESEPAKKKESEPATKYDPSIFGDAAVFGEPSPVSVATPSPVSVATPSSIYAAPPPIETNERKTIKTRGRFGLKTKLARVAGANESMRKKLNKRVKDAVEQLKGAEKNLADFSKAIQNSVSGGGSHSRAKKRKLSTKKRRLSKKIRVKRTKRK